MKIVDAVQRKIADGKTFFSFEFFPPRTAEGVDNLFERMERMVTSGPIFCDITWGAGGSTADVTLDIATRMQNQVCVETMMHLTCTNMQVEKLESALAQVRKAGLQNILALRGDPPKGQEKFEAVEGGLSCALDLVKYIKKTHGDYFGICVAGYPEAHPDTIVEDPEQMEKNYWANIEYLKQKVEAGGELIITQLFYDVALFAKFVKDCRSVGITAPIIPGIMPIMTYGGFKRMTGFCKTKVPESIEKALEDIKDNEEAVKNYGIELGAKMCRELLDLGVPGLHMYSLNLEKTVLSILERMGMIDTGKISRPMPWTHVPVGTRRAVEGVRPIHWHNRPKSYLSRTQEWDKFPVGRWSDTASPAYGALTDHQFMRMHTVSEPRKAKAKAAWGESLSSVADVQACFKRYHEGEISLLPWSEVEGPVAASLKPQLAALADKGLLVINAQPQVNGVSSTDPVHGWGGPGGYVYQKAYLEMFLSPDAFKALKPKLEAAPSVTYMATQASGPMETNMGSGRVNAVTWGAFPASEVLQPNVVDATSFGVWKEEAFELWTSEWSSCYEEGSASRALLKDIANTWYLVSVVDNDFVAGDLFGIVSA